MHADLKEFMITQHMIAQIFFDDHKSSGFFDESYRFLFKGIH